MKLINWFVFPILAAFGGETSTFVVEATQEPQYDQVGT